MSPRWVETEGCLSDHLRGSLGAALHFWPLEARKGSEDPERDVGETEPTVEAPPGQRGCSKGFGTALEHWCGGVLVESSLL